jgi:hypothetical protein
LRRGLIRTRGLLLVTLLLATVSALPGDEAEPLTPEAIVRMHVAGTPTDELIALIRGQPEQFKDISDEMLDELRRAGLPEAVIVAMGQADLTLARERADELDRRFESGSPLRVLLNAGQTKPKRRRIRIRDDVDARLAQEWRLGNAPEDRRFADVAIFLVCRTANHVPDGWRGKTSVRWDSPILQRHRLLAFVSDARWSKGSFLSRIGVEPATGNATNGGGSASSEVGIKETRGTLELAIPLELNTPLLPGLAHDLTVGIALRVREDFYPWTLSSIDGVIIDQAGGDLEVTIRGSSSNPQSLEIQFESEQAEQTRAFVAGGS